MNIEELKQAVKKVDVMKRNKRYDPDLVKLYLCIKNREVDFCDECIRFDEGCPKLNALFKINKDK